MERGQRCEARGHKGKRDEGGARMRSAEKGEREGERKRGCKRKRQGEVGWNGKRKGTTPGTPNHRIVEPLAPRPCLTRVS